VYAFFLRAARFALRRRTAAALDAGDEGLRAAGFRADAGFRAAAGLDPDDALPAAGALRADDGLLAEARFLVDAGLPADGVLPVEAGLLADAGGDVRLDGGMRCTSMSAAGHRPGTPDSAFSPESR
jgi:hypothetical protein